MRHTTLTFSITTLLALAACGGSNNTTPGTGTGTTAKVSQGVVTAASTSSITVNGTPFATTGTGVAVAIDDNPSAADLLKVGMVVTVKVDDKGKAFEIHSKSDVRGLVTAKSGTTVSVGGQVVRVDDSTEFEDNTSRLGGIALNTSRVRVHGFPDDQGGLRATRVDRDDSSSDFEIHGFASGLSSGGFTLKISKEPTATVWTVNYASGVSAPTGLVEGSFVEVKSLALPANNVITATFVKLDDDNFGQVEAEIEGIVTSGTSDSFVIDGHTIKTTGTTVWENGLPADLVTGAKVEAEGTLDANGVLTAKKVSFRDSVRLQGTVTAVDVATSSFTLLGRKVTFSDATEFKASGGSGAPSNPPAVSTQLQVRGSLARNGTDVVAIRVEAATGNAGRIFVQGPVTAKDATAKTLTVLGFTVNAASASFHTSDEVTIMTSDAFFAAVNVGSVVKARGNTPAALDLPTQTLTATEVELEGDR